MLNPKNTVECSTHGTSTATYVCNHLLSGEKKGFNCGYDTNEPDEKWPDAWCGECEEKYQSEQGWNDDSVAFADIQVVCSSCYENLRENNWQSDDQVFDKYLKACQKYLTKKQPSFIKKFNIEHHPEWKYYADQGTLVFLHNNQAQVRAHTSVVGTITEDTQRWTWAWADESVNETEKSASRKIRRLGQHNNDLKLMAATWVSEPKEAEKMMAAMAKFCKAIGSFQIPIKHGTKYLIIHQAQWLNKKTSKWLPFMKNS